MKLINDLGSMLISGMLIIPSFSENRNLEFFNDLPAPIVLVDREISEVKRDTVIVNNHGGAYAATKYMLDNGRRKIAMLGGLKETKTTQNRLKGWKEAMDEHNLYDPELVFFGKFTITSGKEMMQQAFNRLSGIDGIFACNDLIALGAMETIKERKIRIPEEISIVGFDDIYLSKHVTPALTTVRVPLYEEGKISAKLLLDRILSSEKLPLKRIVIS